MSDERAQRAQHFIDRDVMNIAMRIGIPASKAAEMVGNLFYERGEKGVHTVVYGDLRSGVGEAHLNNFVSAILTSYPSKWEHELLAIANEGGFYRGDEPRVALQLEPTPERLAEIRARIRGSI